MLEKMQHVFGEVCLLAGTALKTHGVGVKGWEKGSS